MQCKQEKCVIKITRVTLGCRTLIGGRCLSVCVFYGDIFSSHVIRQKTTTVKGFGSSISELLIENSKSLEIIICLQNGGCTLNCSAMDWSVLRLLAVCQQLSSNATNTVHLSKQ